MRLEGHFKHRPRIIQLAHLGNGRRYREHRSLRFPHAIGRSRGAPAARGRLSCCRDRQAADREGSRTALGDFAVPVRLIAPAAVALPLAEMAIAVALVIAPSARVGAVAAAVMLLAFTLAIGNALIHHRAPECHCFGQIHSAPAGLGNARKERRSFAGRGFCGMEGSGTGGRHMGLAAHARRACPQRGHRGSRHSRGRAADTGLNVVGASARELRERRFDSAWGFPRLARARLRSSGRLRATRESRLAVRPWAPRDGGLR